MMVAERKKFVDVLQITLWFGLLTGLLEVLLLVVQQQFFSEYIFIYRGRDYLWMTPLANVLLFGLSGLLLILAARWFPQMVPFPGLVFFYSFLGAISLLLVVEKFSRFVVVFLALIVAINAARFTYQQEEKFLAVVDKTLSWFVAIFFVLIMVRILVF